MHYDLTGECGVGYTSSGVRFLFDLEDYEQIRKSSWCVSNGYLHGYRNGKEVKMHRLLMKCPDNMVVDHINLDKLDNRKKNLRVCTVSENNSNKNFMSNNKSGKLGVFWDKKRRKWYVQIKKNGVVKYIGLSNSFEKAVAMREEAEKKYFGEFACNI